MSSTYAYYLIVELCIFKVRLRTNIAMNVFVLVVFVFSTYLEFIFIFTRLCSKEKFYGALPIIVGFKWAGLIQSHVLGLFVRKLSEMSIKCGQMQTRNVLVWGENGLLITNDEQHDDA